MSPERGKCFCLLTIIALMVASQITHINGNHRPFNRIIGTLEHFWKLGWKGFRSFPLNYPHLTGVHMNHHRWHEYGPPAVGMPIEGILERKDHPLHEWAKKMYRNGIVATHLNDYTRGKVLPFANVHANVQDRGHHTHKTMVGMSSPSSSIAHEASNSAHQFLTPPSNDPLLSPPFLENPFAQPDASASEIEKMNMFINGQNLNSANLQASSSALSTSSFNPAINDHLVSSPPQGSPALPVFTPHEFTEKEFESFEAMVKKWNDSQFDPNETSEEVNSNNSEPLPRQTENKSNKSDVKVSPSDDDSQIRQEKNLSKQREDKLPSTQEEMVAEDETLSQE